MEDKEELMNKEELTTLPMLQGTSHCSCLEHCFLLIEWDLETRKSKQKCALHLGATKTWINTAFFKTEHALCSTVSAHIFVG